MISINVNQSIKIFVSSSPSYLTHAVLLFIFKFFFSPFPFTFQEHVITSDIEVCRHLNRKLYNIVQRNLFKNSQRILQWPSGCFFSSLSLFLFLVKWICLTFWIFIFFLCSYFFLSEYVSMKMMIFNIYLMNNNMKILWRGNWENENSWKLKKFKMHFYEI